MAGVGIAPPIVAVCGFTVIVGAGIAPPTVIVGDGIEPPTVALETVTLDVKLAAIVAISTTNGLEQSIALAVGSV